jgi:hypothetical protein
MSAAWNRIDLGVKTQPSEVRRRSLLSNQDGQTPVEGDFMENLYRQAFDKIKTKLFTTDSYPRRVGLDYCLQLSNFTAIN